MWKMHMYAKAFSPLTLLYLLCVWSAVLIRILLLYLLSLHTDFFKKFFFFIYIIVLSLAFILDFSKWTCCLRLGYYKSDEIVMARTSHWCRARMRLSLSSRCYLKIMQYKSIWVIVHCWKPDQRICTTYYYNHSYGSFMSKKETILTSSINWRLLATADFKHNVFYLKLLMWASSYITLHLLSDLFSLNLLTNRTCWMF